MTRSLDRTAMGVLRSVWQVGAAVNFPSFPLLRSKLGPLLPVMHWLVNEAVRANIPGAKTATIASSAPLPAAWEQRARELRMAEGSLAAALAPTLRIRIADFERAE